jgi:hypothetical protein
MPVSMIDYSEFVEMFEPSDDFSAYGYGEFEIEWRTVACKNPAREASGLWCAFLWKPNYDDYEGKWIRQEYNGSSSFAMWWYQNSDEINDGSDEEELDGESDDDNDSGCFRVEHEYNEYDCSDNCPHKPGNEPVAESESVAESEPEAEPEGRKKVDGAPAP